MASIEEILGKKIDSVKALRAEIKSLQDSLIGVDAESQEFKDTTQKLTAAQDELTKVTKAGKSENDAAKDSLVGLRQEYKQLYDQYKLLSEEQRNSSFGKEMASQLEGLSDKINDIQKGVGDFRGNVGRYAQSITDAFDMMGVSLGGLQGPLKLATGGFKTLTKSILASPVGWISAAIAALIAIFKKMKEAVGQNEELQMRYNEAMAKFQPIIDAAKNALNGLAEGFVSFVEFISNAVQKIREFGAAVTDFLGITKGAKKDLQDEAKLYDDLAKRTNELTKNKREYEKLNADDQARLDTLKAEAAGTTDLTEKKKLLEEAQVLQQQINERNIGLATEENALLEIQASLTANDAEMNDKLAASQAKVNQTVAEGARKMKELNSQMKSTTNSTNSAAGATRNYRQEAKELYDKLVEDNKDELTKLTEKYEKEKRLLEKYHLDTTLLTKKYNSEKTVIEIQTVQNSQAKIRESYTTGLLQYSKYIEQRKELLKNDAVALADFENQIFEEIKEKYKKISAEQQRINKAWSEDYQKMTEGLTKEEKLKALNELTEKWNLLSEIFNNGDIKKLSNYSVALEHLNGKIAEYAGKNDAYSKLMTNIFKGEKHALEEMGAEGWANTTNKLQEYIDVLRDAYGITIDTGEELTRLGEILENNIKEGLGNKAIAEINEKLKANNEKALEGLIKTISHDSGGYAVYVEEENRKALELEKATLEESIYNFAGTQEQKIELQKKYYEVLQTLSEKQAELETLSQQRTLEMVENLTAAIDSMANAMGTYQSSQEALIDSQLKAGKIDEKEARAKKKRLLNLQAVQTAFNIATITADAASGIFAIWKGYAQERGQINPQTAAAAGVGAGPVLAALNTKSLISAIAQTTSLAATASAQIMAARNGYIAAVNNFNAEGASSSGSEGLASTPALIASEPYTYTQQIQNTEEEDELNRRPIIVRVSDILDGLNTRAVQVRETTF